HYQTRTRQVGFDDEALWLTRDHAQAVGRAAGNVAPRPERLGDAGVAEHREAAARTEPLLLRRVRLPAAHPIANAEDARRLRVPQPAMSPQRQRRADAAKLLDAVEVAEVVGHVVAVEVHAEPSGLRLEELRDIGLPANQGGIRSGPVEARQTRRIVDRLAEEEPER